MSREPQLVPVRVPSIGNLYLANAFIVQRGQTVSTNGLVGHPHEQAVPLFVERQSARRSDGRLVERLQRIGCARVSIVAIDRPAFPGVEETRIAPIPRESPIVF